MFIGLCGGAGAGKHSVTQYLVDHEQFIQLDLVTDQREEDQVTRCNMRNRTTSAENTFATPEALLEFVTKRWNQRWIIARIESSSFLELLQRRPFFLLVHIDAPVSLRWERLVHA